MARTKKKSARYDDDYDMGKSYDDYDYGKTNDDHSTELIEDDQDEEGAELGRIQIWNAINNTALFVIAYMIMFLLTQGATSGMAYRRFMNSVIRFYITNVTPYEGNWLVNAKAIIWIYSSGPVLCFLTAIASYLIYWKFFQKTVGLFRKFLLWIHVIGMLMSLGYIGSGILITDSYRGIGYVVAWSGNTMVWRYTYIGVATVLMMLVGFWTAKAFLQTATRSEMVRRRGGARIEYLFFTVLLPMLIGSFIVSLPRLPQLENYELVGLLFLMPTVIAMFSYGRQIATLRLVRSMDDVPVSKIAIALAAVILIGTRIILDPGIRVDAFDPKFEKQPVKASVK